MVKKIKGLTIHFMPYSEIRHEDASGRIKKILSLVLKDVIVILQGRLKPEEEARLIGDTMALIGNVKGFKGIEIAPVSGEDSGNVFDRIRQSVAKILVGEQDVMTVIGPANIVREIKKDKRKLELMLKR